MTSPVPINPCWQPYDDQTKQHEEQIEKIGLVVPSDHWNERAIMSSRRCLVNKQTVQISLHASKLANTHKVVGTADPFAVVTLIPPDIEELPTEVGKTEVIENSLSPRWVKTFEADFELGEPTKILIKIYDQNQKNHNRPMGSALFELNKVLTADGSIKGKKLKTGGILYCRVQKAPEKSKGTLNLSLRGIKLKNVDGYFGKSDPFFELARMVEASSGGKTWQLEYRSPVVMNDLNPEWDPISVGLDDLCDGEKRQPILITVRDWEKSGKHKFMGSIQTSLHHILDAVSPEALGDPKKADLSKAYQLKKKGKHMGYICVTGATIVGERKTEELSRQKNPAYTDGELTDDDKNGIDFSKSPGAKQKRFSFVDYVSGGLDLQMTVAIDFASSNGDPTDSGSLHYLRPDKRLNDYEKAIVAIGDVLSNYDSDQQFPVLGFGAKVGGVLNHCFQLGPVPQVYGVRGILEAYRGQFETDFEMSGPTLFTEIIDHAAEQARRNHEEAIAIGDQYYQILLILTDGKVSNTERTREAIRAASDAPLSIVIIGIGKGDFSTMQYLDDFQEFESGQGRDICQFVEFQKHKHSATGLTHATLDEIPFQVVDFFHERGIAPLPSMYSSQKKIVAEEADEE